MKKCIFLCIYKTHINSHYEGLYTRFTKDGGTTVVVWGVPRHSAPVSTHIRNQGGLGGIWDVYIIKQTNRDCIYTSTFHVQIVSSQDEVSYPQL